MEEFLNYLNNYKKAANNNFDLYENVHIVLGNESCDLDSTVSSILLAYFLYIKKLPNLNLCAIIPILNVPFEHFTLRTEVVFALQEAGIDVNSLIFKDQVDFKNLLDIKSVKVSLVDHHILAESDRVLENYVTQIFDHRPVDPNNNWDSKILNILIEPVGSCSTLIGNEIFKTDYNILPRNLAYLLYETIIYDTIALLPENGKAKKLDVEIGSKLENIFNFTEDRKAVFDKLWTEHCDISKLTPYQLLLKDLKIVEGTYVPGLPMLVEDFVKIETSLSSLNEFTTKNNISHLVLVGLEAKGSVVRRDIGLFWTNNCGKHIIDLLVCRLLKSCGGECDFDFSEQDLKLENLKIFKQKNTKLSRKQLVPIIKEVVKVK